jgi:hypothetical protein
VRRTPNCFMRSEIGGAGVDADLRPSPTSHDADSMTRKRDGYGGGVPQVRAIHESSCAVSASAAKNPPQS